MGESRVASVLVSDWCLTFFFSSRRRHTRLQGDWSSDVCSSDLHHCAQEPARKLKVIFGGSNHEVFSTPTNAIFKNPASRSRFITSINSPYGTTLSADRKSVV